MEHNKPQTLLITGAAKRIGSAIALNMAQHGTRIALHYNRSEKNAKEIAKNIQERGGEAVLVQSDLMKSEETATLLERATEKLGAPIECLINNASLFENDDIATFTTQDLNKHIKIHVEAPALLSQAMAKQTTLEQSDTKKDKTSKLIINIIDQRVWALTPRFFTYTLSKSALWTMTQTLAQSLAPSIRVNALGPGPTLPNERQSMEDFDKQSKAVLMQKGASLPDFARSILYLWQTPSITGQMIALDGGQHLSWQTPDVMGIKE